MKQFLLHLDEKLELGKKFVTEDLDDTHLFIDSELVESLKDKIDELMVLFSFSVYFLKKFSLFFVLRKNIPTKQKLNSLNIKYKNPFFFNLI
jgi:TFIIH basal transcription factor complex TTD-A subunit